MSHARIEEVSDSDPSEGDISDVSDDFDEREILRARPSAVPKPQVAPSLINPSNIPSSAGPRTHTAPDGTQFVQAEDQSKYASFECLYPVYFDVSRSRREGRMVGKELAVENPLAREIVNACGRLGLETLFEPTKIHPKDWSNPGRVKIKLKGGRNSSIKNKHHLYTLVSAHLKANPSTHATASLVRVPGVPPPDATKEYPQPAVPKRWKMNTLLPHYSPALTGGGVSDNFFKDMMAEMQGAGGAGGAGGMPGMPDLSAMQAMMGGGGGSATPPQGAIEGKKKDKKKKK
ncbi:signal recognition particle subunit [Cadophora gregata]|uniref:signal recognition particle subunit n=1 Tax=Cadophora gregata TaxID=51156 RepID=UPI0026DC9E4C|nr:signal recognition particle subunit [Cadophora gregata]KAK0125699.1 signal recognition particle subunit [Cadophora gregata f. sp. sojae]KAK0128322.1 signal recognition particle subunit [Cadophora gregata]